MNILVTGGAGFIGSHVIDKLLNLGHFVVCIDNFDPFYNIKLKRKNLEHQLLNPNFKLVEGDILNRDIVLGVFKENNIEVVIHEAAQAGVRFSIKNPFKTHEINTTGTLNILEALKSDMANKMVLASSSSVYGKIQYLPFDEEHPKMPISPYGVSKLMAENYCRVYSEIYGFGLTMLRYFTVYGPRMRPDLAISIFIQKALQNENIEIFGDGTSTRDYTYIDDAVKATVEAINKRYDGDVYNIGSGSRISVKDLAEKILKMTNSKSEIKYIDWDPGDVEHTWANITKAKRKLNWEPQINIDTGLKIFVEWLKNEC